MFSFQTAAQIYHKVNLASHLIQTTKSDFEPPLHGQMYFLDLGKTVEERLADPLHYGISSWNAGITFISPVGMSD